MNNDIKDLRAKSQDFIELINEAINDDDADHEMLWWINRPISDHIAKLQKRVDEFEAGMQKLKQEERKAKDHSDSPEFFSMTDLLIAVGKAKGLGLAISIMTEGE